MEYNIKIDELSPDFWEKMNELGIKRFAQADGLIYQYVSFDTAVKILKSNCLNYSVPNKFNDPFNLTSGLFDTSITK